MKYGFLDFDKTVQWYWENTWNNKALLNIGDAIEYKVIKQFYHDLDISDSQMVPLSINDLTSYRGESLIVALNIALDSYVGYNYILDHLSPDIIPVFLGMSLTSTDLNDKQLQCLRTYAPIGCRDQRSYEYLKEKGIFCYLNGCCASALRVSDVVKNTAYEGKVLFIDVPQSLASFVPQALRKEAVFFNQEIYCKQTEMHDGILPSEWAQSILNVYKSNVKAIITSRFHGAVLALALGIPVILTLEQKTFRFSWLSNYCQVFEEGEFDRIDWDFTVSQYETTKSQLYHVCLQRISEVSKQYEPLLLLSDLQKNQKRVSSKTNHILYYQKALQQIRQKWNTNDEISYAFWGTNQNSDCLLKAIKHEFPNAKLVDVYDMNRTVVFEGITSKHPRELEKCRQKKNYYLIVTAYLASRVADDIFAMTGFPNERAFLCEREFLNIESLLL